jgi:hypothetical protein
MCVLSATFVYPKWTRFSIFLIPWVLCILTYNVKPFPLKYASQLEVLDSHYDFGLAVDNY